MQSNKNKLKDPSVKCFAPLKGKSPKILILGTMPGQASLEKQQYYGYTHNSFWKIMFDMFNIPFSADYKERQKLIKSRDIALWDTIASCQRQGSSDTAIKDIKYNNIGKFLKDNAAVKAVFFNGQFAHKVFIKGIAGNISIDIFVLPSTSPANTVKYDKKLKEWLKIRAFLD